MLDKKGFDRWAGSYDENIEESSEGYPFEGYYDVLIFIQNSIRIDENTTILDLGIGTGLLHMSFIQRINFSHSFLFYE